jgi:hypothetical protein
LEYGFPLKFFANTENMSVSQTFYESTFSEGRDLLVLREYYMTFISSTLSEVQRRFLMNYNDIQDAMKKKAFPMMMINFRTQDGSNIFHFLVKDYKVLKKFYQNFMKHVEDIEDEDERKKELELFLLILYPNNKELTPFEIAMRASSQFVDVFLRMLTEVPDYQLSRFIFNELSVFRQVLRMGLPSFTTFLQRCMF